MEENQSEFLLSWTVMKFKMGCFFQRNILKVHSITKELEIVGTERQR